jgi:neutral ceramidase
MGRRVAQTVRRTIRPEVKDVIVIGLANEYVSYFATPEEYQAQHYEGASTLYGGESGPVILEEIRKLSIELDNHPPAASPARDFSYAAGVSRSFVLSVNDGTAAFPRAIAVDLTNGGQIAGALLPTHCWREPYSDLRTSPADRTIPTVWIEHQAVAGTWQAFAPNGAREDDHGLNFVAIARRVAVNTIEWCSGWLGAPREETSQQFRFCVQTARGVAGGCSNTFTVPRR